MSEAGTAAMVAEATASFEMNAAIYLEDGRGSGAAAAMGGLRVRVEQTTGRRPRAMFIPHNTHKTTLSHTDLKPQKAPPASQVGRTNENENERTLNAKK